MNAVKRNLLILYTMVMIAGCFVTSMDVCAKHKTKKWTIDDVKSTYAIESDVRLDGYGDGYHAKLVMVTPLSGISFGIQYDTNAYVPYKNRLALLFENIYSNNPGEQFYYRPSNVKMKFGKTYHLMMTLNKKDGRASVFFNHRKLATYVNKRLKNKEVDLRVEGSCKHNGDIIKSEFKNIRIKNSYFDETDCTLKILDTAPNLKSTIKDYDHVQINGHLSGIGATQDWDSAFSTVSGIVQFNLYDDDDDYDYDYYFDD